MNTLSLEIRSGTQFDHFDQVSSFVGWDESGCFGLMANHCDFMTFLEFGLANFKHRNSWHYIALPTALLTCRNNLIEMTTRHYLISSDIDEVEQSLLTQIRSEEEQLANLKQNLEGIEQEIMRRLWQLSREGYAL